MTLLLTSTADKNESSTGFGVCYVRATAEKMKSSRVQRLLLVIFSIDFLSVPLLFLLLPALSHLLSTSSSLGVGFGVQPPPSLSSNLWRLATHYRKLRVGKERQLTSFNLVPKCLLLFSKKLPVCNDGLRPPMLLKTRRHYQSQFSIVLIHLTLFSGRPIIISIKCAHY